MLKVERHDLMIITNKYKRENNRQESQITSSNELVSLQV